MGAPDHIVLFESRRSFLIGLAYRILGSLADAEDAVQDTLLAIHTLRHTFDPDRPIDLGYLWDKLTSPSAY